MSFVRVGDHRAPSVTLLPGFMGGRASWDIVLDLLPSDLTVRVLDLPGHGSSDALASGRGWRESIAPLSAECVSSRPDVLVGYSMGGRLALAIALASPKSFRHVVAIGADLGIRDADERAVRTREDEARAALLLEKGVETFINQWETEPLFATQLQLPRRTLEIQRRMRLQHSPKGLAFALRNLGAAAMPDLRDALAMSDLRITFVAGGLDPKFLPLAQEGARLCAHGECAVVRDVGHNVPLEAPQETARLIAGCAARYANQSISDATTVDSQKKPDLGGATS